MQKDYSNDLQLLQHRVEKCDIDTFESIDFFLKEANVHFIPIDIEKNVRWEINKFKRNCMCIKPTILRKYIGNIK